VLTTSVPVITDICPTGTPFIVALIVGFNPVSPPPETDIIFDEFATMGISRYARYPPPEYI
jgi:hypothetical protein